MRQCALPVKAAVPVGPVMDLKCGTAGLSVSV